ncbi:alpha/beta hydrolase [Nocardia vaccinii]|uniref:alpha/beta hydrolase n=1 Tax=Nocardia vaccinii TaxID=1822 RepID=UPI001C3FC3D4|nr:alpha/beta hydrolase [Nocardia vaccinii]
MSGPSLQAAAIPFIRGRIAAAAESVDLEALAGVHGLSIREFEIPGDDTGPSTIATAVAPASQLSAGAAIFYVHGGGMVMGHRLDSIAELAALAERFAVPVITVDYRLAPEHPFPAAADDVLRAWRWVTSNAGELSIDATKILLTGVSAGGGLAGGLALRLRDGAGTQPSALALLCPMLDEHNDSGSSRDYSGTSVWDRESNELGWASLLGPDRHDVSPYASPSRAVDVSGLPPLLLEAGSAEVFRDEVVEFASRVWEAGGQAELHVWAGAFHGIERFAPESRVAQAASDARLTWFARQLGTT